MFPDGSNRAGLTSVTVFSELRPSFRRTSMVWPRAGGPSPSGQVQTAAHEFRSSLAQVQYLGGQLRVGPVELALDAGVVFLVECAVLLAAVGACGVLPFSEL